MDGLLHVRIHAYHVPVEIRVFVHENCHMSAEKRSRRLCKERASKQARMEAYPASTLCIKSLHTKTGVQSEFKTYLEDPYRFRDERLAHIHDASLLQ